MSITATEESDLAETQLPGAVSIDHLAFTVSDLDAAVAFLAAELDGQECYREGPISDPGGDWMARKLGVPAEASTRVAMVRMGKNLNLELFGYTCPGANTTAPQSGAPGATCLLLAVPDLAGFTERIRSTGTAVELDRVARFQVFGLTFEVIEDPTVTEPFHVLGASYTVADIEAAQRFLTTVIGMAPQDGAFRLGHGPQIVLRPASKPGRPPGNHDVGGHHFAFAVADVDRAADYLAPQPGVLVMGTPETVTTGPIIGDRWVYFSTPIGLQMELICMPDGNLPYELETSARRWAPC